MPSIHNIVDDLNEAMLPTFSQGALQGSDLNNIAVTVNKGESRMPAVILKNGEGIYVGLEDKYPARLYHKILQVASSVKAGTGYGRDTGFQVNTYLMAMVVFLNRRRTKLYPDELMLMIQDVFPVKIEMRPFREINILFNRVSLNDLEAYNQEYVSTEYKLLPEHNLFQIFYQVETVFKRGCFNICDNDYNT